MARYAFVGAVSSLVARLRGRRAQMSNVQVLAVGQGKMGQLGLGAKAMETTEFRPLESLNGKKVEP